MYPNLAITDLVVFDDDTSTTADDDSCTAFADGKTGNNYFYSDLELTTAVTSSSTVIYFDGKVSFYLIEKLRNSETFFTHEL